MIIVADTHVHLYPCHDRAAWLRAAFRNLHRKTPHAKVVMLTERHDCHAFRDWPAERVGSDAVRVQENGDSLFILPGRQVVTKERLEILALLTDADIADGQPIRDVLSRVRDAGGLPVLAWAPGKWFFKRGKVVLDVLDREAPGSLLIGDTSLRPTIWPEPDLMSYGHQKGFRVIAGSDPLPFAGEEKYVGSYGILAEAEFDETRPAAAIRAMLQNPGTKAIMYGQRCGLMDVVTRLRKNKASRSR